MLELNKVLLIGNLTRDPELSYVANGTALAKLGLAVGRRWKDRNSGEMREETAFVDIDAWAGTAEFCGKYLKKGRRIFVEGRLNFQSWQTPEGNKRSKLTVTADRIQFADPPPSAQGGGGGGNYGGDQQGPSGGTSAATSRPAQQSQPEPFPDDEPPSDETADDLPF